MLKHLVYRTLDAFTDGINVQTAVYLRCLLASMAKAFSDHLQAGTLTRLPTSKCSSQIVKPEVFDLRGFKDFRPGNFWFVHGTNRASDT